MPRKLELFNAEMITKAIELLETGITVDNACKKLGVNRSSFDASLRKQPELKNVYEKTKELRRYKGGSQKPPSESQLNASISNLGYKDPLLARVEFRHKFEKEKRELTLRNLKDPYG